MDLAQTVYQIDITMRRLLSVCDLANVFAAFRWGGLLKLHRTSAMEFPYSVAGLTEQHVKMRWPNIDDPNAPDKPGGRFRMPFGAVPGAIAVAIATVEAEQHGWDVARATNQLADFDPEVAEAAMANARMMPPEQARQPGVFGPEVPCPSHAPVHDRLAAFLGRAV